MGAETLFRSKAPKIMDDLIKDFNITIEDAAAILGNLGHECAGFTLMQEVKPTIAGSKGGFGWAQWTGPRRRAYEAYCKRNGYNPTSDEANYKYLFLELKGIEGTEGKAIDKLVAAKGLDAKVEAFEKAFLRAGIKHYDSRKQWARIALDQYDKVRVKYTEPKSVPKPKTNPIPIHPAPPITTNKEVNKVPLVVRLIVLAIVAVVIFAAIALSS